MRGLPCLNDQVNNRYSRPLNVLQLVLDLAEKASLLNTFQHLAETATKTIPSCNFKASDDKHLFFLTPRMRVALQLMILMLYLRLLYYLMLES